MRRILTLLLSVAAFGCGDDKGGGSTAIDSGGATDVRAARDMSTPFDASGGDAIADVFDGECREDADCSDDIYCNGVERCFEGTCFPSPVEQCKDPSACTQDVCDEENKRCDFVPDDSLCAPGQVCDSKAGCFTPADCAIDADCEDGLLCNGAERCVAGECQPGTPVECDDGVDCTADACVEGLGECQSVADHNLCLPTELCGLIAGCTARPPCTRDDDCDDGLYCNGVEKCSDGVCAPGQLPDVPDTLDCTIDQCSESLDMVLHSPDNARCSDGQFCNGAEVCHPANGCGMGVPPVLSDGVGCTEDTCDEDNDFIEHTPNDVVCDDGLFCNGEEVCHPIDDCQPGEPPLLNDGIGCTTDTCSEVNDEILHIPDDTLCNDGLFCNGVETCDAVLDCQAGLVPGLDDGVNCTVDTCNEGTDTVSHTPDPTSCDDGLFCNGAEVCDPVLDCQSGAPPDGSDGVDCTVDRCVEATDSFTHTPDDGLCDDADVCNGAETCSANGCVAGTPLDTSDGVGCTDDLCDPITGMTTHSANDANCDNGAYCDGTETCHPTNDCQAGTPPPIVDDGDPCTLDFCDENSDSDGHSTRANGYVCASSPRSICLSGNCLQSICGDNYVDTGRGEQCDDGGTVDNDGCDSNCQDEVASCSPDGTWSVSWASAPYSCLSGLVAADIDTIVFSGMPAKASRAPDTSTILPAPSMTR